MELNTRYTLTTKYGFISETGVYQLISFINRQDLQSDIWKAANPASVRTFLPPLPSEWDWEWMVTKGDYRGALPKRVSSYFLKQYGIKCPNKFMTELGNIAKSHTSESETYTFEFVDEIDWYAGEFGESEDSCYWNDRAGARRMIIDNGGLAVRFYGGKYEEGVARAWMAKIGDGVWVLWNGYGFSGNATLTIARIVATHLGASYKKIDLCNYGSDYGVLYINGGIGYAIGKHETIATIFRHDLRWTNIDIRVCYECGDEIDEDEYRVGADEHSYCERCYERLFDYCEHCEETHWIEDLRYTGHETVCEYCLDQNYLECDRCGEYERRRDARTRGDETLCESCYEDDVEEVDDE